jgi:hypothetical protein
MLKPIFYVLSLIVTSYIEYDFSALKRAIMHTLLGTSIDKVI